MLILHPLLFAQIAQWLQIRAGNGRTDYRALQAMSNEKGFSNIVDKKEKFIPRRCRFWVAPAQAPATPHTKPTAKTRNSERVFSEF